MKYIAFTVILIAGLFLGGQYTQSAAHSAHDMDGMSGVACEGAACDSTAQTDCEQHCFAGLVVSQIDSDFLLQFFLWVVAIASTLGLVFFASRYKPRAFFRYFPLYLFDTVQLIE